MLLEWSQSDLAKHAQVSITVIARVETASVDARLSTILAILKTFEDHGIEFVEEGDGSFGVLHHRSMRRAVGQRRPWTSD